MIPQEELRRLTASALRGDDIPILQLYEVLKDPRVPHMTTFKVCSHIAMRACGVEEGQCDLAMAVAVVSMRAPWPPGYQAVLLQFKLEGQRVEVKGFVTKEY